MKKDVNRSEYIDIIKGLAVVLVVIGHCIQFGSGNIFLNEKRYFDNFLFKGIYSFHMPLFMLVSGFLFYRSSLKYDEKECILVKLNSLGIPIVIWGTIDFFIWWVSNGFLIGLRTIKIYVVMIINAPWFLWATLMCCILASIIKRFARDHIVVHLFMVPLFMFTPDLYNFVWLKFMYPFFMVGYFWHKYQLDIRWEIIEESKKLLLTILLFASFISILVTFSEEDFIYNTYIYIYGNRAAENQIAVDLYRWVAGFVGSANIMTIIYHIWKLGKLKWNVLKCLGIRSLGIYLINGYVNTLLNRITESMFYNTILVFGETIVVLIVCLLFTMIIECNHFLNRFLFGNRKTNY